MNRLTLTVLFVALFTITGFAADLVPLQSAGQAEPLQVNVVGESQRGLSLELSATAIFAESMTGDAAGHTLLSWADAGVEGEIGQPQLPVRRMLVAIPYGATVEASVVNATWTEISLNDLTGASMLMPVQPPLEKVPGAVAPFTKNVAAYQAGYSNHAVVEVEDYMVMRGQQLALVVVRPLDYNPTAGTIRVASELEIDLNFAGGDLALTEQKAARYQSPRTNALLRESVINDPGRELDDLPESMGYIIIAPNNATYLAAMEPYIEWKTAQGWDVTVALTSDIGSSTTLIKAYLQDAYDTWPVPPSFVLLLGDTDVIPYWVGSGTGSPNTDLNYSMLEGTDFLPDVGLGRFPVANLDDLQNMIDKTMQYEQVTWTAGNDWVKHSTFMASVDNYQITEGTHNYVLNNYLSPAGFTADLLYQVTYGATTQDVTNSFNAGVSLGTYSGHGSATSWADGPPFSQANVNALTNDVFPFVQSYACVTGSYHLAECFAETWVRHSAGAVAFMGSSVNSYWTEDDVMEKKVFEAFFDNQTPGDIYNLTWINGMINYSKMKLVEQWGTSGTVRRYCEMYNIFGDGSIDLWTNVPQDVTVNHPAAFFLGMDQLDVSVPDAPSWARVCVQSSAEPDIIAAGYTDQSGNISITLPAAPTLPGTLNITVTGHDIDPYMAQIPLTASDGAYVVYESVTVNDAAGWNPNGVLDYDESALLSVTVQNVGVDPSHDPTSVQLTDVADMVTFSDNAENYPAIPAGESVTVTDGFALTVDAGVADGSPANVPVFIADSWDFWESVMPLIVAAPEAAITNVTFSDDPNGNNWLDPGEDAWIHVTLTNEGSSPIMEGYANLSENGDPYVTITTDNTEYFAQLDPGASVDMAWGISASAACPQDYDMSLLFDLDADHSFATQIDIPLTVGDILFLPSGPDSYGYLAYDPNDGNNAMDFNWFEISTAEGGPGTNTGIDDDDMTVHVTLPFTFVYYGQSYTGLTIDSNGTCSFGPTQQSYDYSNSSIPNSDGPSAMLAPYWEDLNIEVNGSDGVYIYYHEAMHRYIVEWSHISQYSPSGTFETFQAVLYDPAFHPTTTGDGIIQFQYLDITSEVGNDGTVGIESPSETDGIEYVYQTDYDVHATPITDAFSITILTEMGEGLEAPSNLTYSIVPNGTVTLNWDFAGMYTIEELTEPAIINPGEKPDVMREDDRIQLEEWRTNGIPGNVTDEFLNFVVYRDNTNIGEPTVTTFEDVLNTHGDYQYYVTAMHTDGESLPSNIVSVSYDPIVSLTVTPLYTFIMPGGGDVTYDVNLTSSLPNPQQNVDYWTKVTLPNGNVLGPVFMHTFNMPANANMTASGVTQYVPGTAPAGVYTHTSFVGYYPNLIGATDSFTFSKAGTTTEGKIDLSEWTVSGFDLVNEEVVSVSNPLPTKFEVGRAYPNPFNAMVSVPFALPDAGQVEIALYNVLGQQVMARTLQQTAGYHTFNVDGGSLSSGLYLLSIKGFGENQQQKVMLLK